MPPKKSAAALKATKTATVKAKTTKKKTEAEKPVQEAEQEEMPVKTSKEKPAKKTKAQKEEPEVENTKVEAPPKKKKAATAASKNGKSEEPNKAPTETENGTKKKVTKRKQAAELSSEKNDGDDAVSAKIKKTAAPRAKRGKKMDVVEDGPENDEHAAQGNDEEEAPEEKKPKKGRGAPKKQTVEVEKTETKPYRTNATVTNWAAIDFKCTSKNAKGKTPNFHITSWNVDGLRAWLKKGGLDILEHDQPDIFCIQETKCSLEKLPEEVTEIDGYKTFWCSSDKEGYAGVGIASKIKPINVEYGIGDKEQDVEGRCITAEYEKFFLVNVYVPNAGRRLVTLPKRLEWNKLFEEYIKKLDKRKPVILCGDMNVAHQEIDLANPKSNTKNAGFTPEEREGMTDFLEAGYVDTFRKLYPDKEKAYTFWTYLSNARSKNVGWRLDYFLVSERFMENVCDNIIHSDVLGSDHCPLSLHINI